MAAPVCTGSRHAAAVALVLVIGLSSGWARAAPPQVADAPDWAFGEPAAEVALAATSALFMAAYALPQAVSDWAPSTEQTRNDHYGEASDYTGSVVGTSWQLVGSWALEGGYYDERGIADPYGRALRTSLMDTEAVLLATGITTALKRLTARCRPRAWRDGRCAGGEYNAFPSGHVTPVAALAGSRLVLAAQSDSGAVRRQLAFGFAEGTTLATGALRILAGAHSWEDVVVAWTIGHVTGALTALAHPLEPIAAEPVGATAGAVAASSAWDIGFRWSGAF